MEQPHTRLVSKPKSVNDLTNKFENFDLFNGKHLQINWRFCEFRHLMSKSVENLSDNEALIENNSPGSNSVGGKNLKDLDRDAPKPHYPPKPSPRPRALANKLSSQTFRTHTTAQESKQDNRVSNIYEEIVVASPPKSDDKSASHNFGISDNVGNPTQNTLYQDYDNSNIVSSTRNDYDKQAVNRKEKLLDSSLSINENKNPIIVTNLETPMSRKSLQNNTSTNNGLSNTSKKVSKSVQRRITFYVVHNDTREEGSAVSRDDILLGITKEIKNSEEGYINTLKEIVPIYKYVINRHTSENIRSNTVKICNDIDQIVDQQIKFWNKLKESKNTIEALIEDFSTQNLLFRLYDVYFKEHNENITIRVGDEQNLMTISLSSILTQKLTQYKMFWARIVKELNDSKFYEAAVNILHILTRVLGSCERSLLLATIQNNPLFTDIYGNLTNKREASELEFVRTKRDHTGYGMFLLRDTFLLAPKREPYVILLFEKVILFTKENKDNELLYENHVLMSDIRLQPTDKKDILLIEDYKQSKRYHKKTIFKCVAPSETIGQKWDTRIREHLWTQVETLKKVHKTKKTIPS